ncbi:MAG TPA: thioredoxin [Candidatus Methanomethylophilaceae archaeon]|nr:thioredoxin [Candidatus Methanomethylophilaceae archaeon]
MVTELKESNFDSFIEENEKVLIDCWAPWCGPCRRMGPIIEEIDAGEKDFAVAKLNTDENQSISARFNINAIPTLLIFKDGVLAKTLVGLRPKDEILSAVNGV